MKELFGRKKIFTDEKRIDQSNVIQVLQDALIEHERNVADMRFLLKFEKGKQPLARKKEIRQDIDIQVCDNVAGEIVDFKLGYNWGNPITLVQRGNKDLNGSDSDIDDTAISLLNEMIDSEGTFAKDQEMARYIEICGVGYRMVDIKNDYLPGGSVFDILTLNPLFAFIVYSNDAYRRPMMGCTFRKNKKTGERFYTCYTDERRYEIKSATEIINGEKDKLAFSERSGEMNPLGMIPIAEYMRSYDGMGCFERHISDMDALNILVSDFSNNVSQETQSIWWGNDFELPSDKDGKPKKRSGMWLMTKTAQGGTTPSIKPLTLSVDYAGILENIRYRRDTILKKCKVPLTSDPGGGSTGTAMSMSSGWSAAEVDACKEEPIIRYGKMQELRLILVAIKKSPDIDENSPLLRLNLSDITIRIIRNKTYDMATKANTFAAYIRNGINGRHALQVIDAFPDVAQTWSDSKEVIEKYQESMSSGEDTKNKTDNDRLMSDLSDQSENSPITSNAN